MGMERTRAFLLRLPRVAEVMQWGGKLVYFVGDRAVGGKMFALMPLEPGEADVLAFAAGPERGSELLELEGVRPAPYLARAHWVALERWDVLSERILHEHLQAAYARVEAKLPPRVQRALALPHREYRALVRERRLLGESRTNH